MKLNGVTATINNLTFPNFAETHTLKVREGAAFTKLILVVLISSVSYLQPVTQT